MTSQDGAVNHPKHYNEHPSGVECIDIVRHMTFNVGNVFKYLWRNGLKDGEPSLKDMRKAEFYLKDEIARLELAESEALAGKNPTAESQLPEPRPSANAEHWNAKLVREAAEREALKRKWAVGSYIVVRYPNDGRPDHDSVVLYPCTGLEAVSEIAKRAAQSFGLMLEYGLSIARTPGRFHMLQGAVALHKVMSPNITVYLKELP